jgi:hypothetical protein
MVIDAFEDKHNVGVRLFLQGLIIKMVLFNNQRILLLIAYEGSGGEF